MTDFECDCCDDQPDAEYNNLAVSDVNQIIANALEILANDFHQNMARRSKTEAVDVLKAALLRTSNKYRRA